MIVTAKQIISYPIISKNVKGCGEAYRMSIPIGLHDFSR